jgi:hypothetical protein
MTDTDTVVPLHAPLDAWMRRLPRDSEKTFFFDTIHPKAGGLQDTASSTRIGGRMVSDRHLRAGLCARRHGGLREWRVAQDGRSGTNGYETD